MQNRASTSVCCRYAHSEQKRAGGCQLPRAVAAQVIKARLYRCMAAAGPHRLHRNPLNVRVVSSQSSVYSSFLSHLFSVSFSPCYCSALLLAVCLRRTSGWQNRATRRLLVIVGEDDELPEVQEELAGMLKRYRLDAVPVAVRGLLWDCSLRTLLICVYAFVCVSVCRCLRLRR